MGKGCFDDFCFLFKFNQAMKVPAAKADGSKERKFRSWSGGTSKLLIHSKSGHQVSSESHHRGVASTDEAASNVLFKLLKSGLRHNKSLKKRIRWSDELPSEAAVVAARRAASGEEGETGGGRSSGSEEVDGGRGEECGDSGNVIRYTREELMEMKTLPLSRKKPACLSTINSIIVTWDSNNSGKKRSDTPNDDERIGRDGYGDKRRSNDPRERIRKESEGIVLSPQRRSFNSGCFVVGGGIGLGAGAGGGISVAPSAAAPVPGIGANVRLRPDSPLFAGSRNGDTQKDVREIRRLGSGRLWERGAVPPSINGDDNTEYTSYRSSRDRGDDRYERRSFGRDMYGDKNRNDRDNRGGMMDRERDRDRLGDRDRDRDMESRYSDRRDRDDRRNTNNRYMKDYRKMEKEDEPEWFSGGPTSQHDTIELHGFDDIPRSPPHSQQNSSNNLTNEENSAADNSSSATLGNQSSLANSNTSEANNSSHIMHLESAANWNDKEPMANTDSNSSNNTSNQQQQTGVKVKQIRRSAGSGRTPSAVAANQNKDPPVMPEDFMNEDVIKKALSPIGGDDAKDDSRQHLASDLYLDEFLKMDNIPGLGLNLMANGAPEESYSGGSRFSKWFSRQSPTNTQKRAESPRQEQLLGNIMNDLEPSIHIPQSGESPHLFAPISPAASSSITPGGNNNMGGMNHVGGNSNSGAHALLQYQHQQNQQHNNSLLEMLRRGQPHQQNHLNLQNYQQFGKSNSDVPGKFQSVEELEARIRGGAINQQSSQQQHNPMHQQQQSMMHNMKQHRGGSVAPHHMGHHQPPQDDEIDAFKRLMAQVSVPPANNNQPSNNMPKAVGAAQPLSLLQMLSKSQQADQAALEAQQHQQSGAIPHQDFLSKLLHVPHAQQQQPPRTNLDQHKLIPGNMNSNRHYQVSPTPNDIQAYMNTLQPSRELLQRPEAQAIVHGLRAGEITPQNLMQQIANPGVQSRHRELLASILKLHQQQMAVLSPRNRLGVPTNPSHRISPQPINGIPQRIPSPRELQARTQSIMQNALIKKKLEEQSENYRKRQEQQAQQQAQLLTHSTSSPTKHQSTIAFTPTSVLRNMTADKESEQQKQHQSSSIGMNSLSNNPILKSSNLSNNNNSGGLIMQQHHSISSSTSTGNNSSAPAGWGPPPSGMGMSQGGHMPPKHGRPIVKGGMGMPSYQPNINEFPPHHLQHQFVQQANFPSQMQMHMQQQQHAGGRQHPIMPQQAQQPPNNMVRGVNPLHQMLLQQRNINEGGDMMGPALSPTSNQLALWFTPEIRAKANAGKLPSINMAANMLSLEELERIQHIEDTVIVDS